MDRRLTPDEKAALANLMGEIEAMVEFDPTPEELEEIERLGREHPLPEDEARRFYGRIQEALVRASNGDDEFSRRYRERVSDPAWLDNLMAERAERLGGV